jgi:signal transduction histidine kinase
MIVQHAEISTSDLRDIAKCLAGRREEILSAWKSAVEADPELRMASTTTRAQFIDHIPSVLDAFEARLSSRDASDRAQAREAERESAAEHGLHRWQQGYDLPETMCEWGHLHLCLLEELENCRTVIPQISPAALRTARRELLQLCSDGVCASATRYTRLQQHDAATRVRELEFALAELTQLEQDRAQAWREAAHDLRGRAHAIASASAVLTREEVPEPQRARFSEMLKRGVSSLNKLLGDLMDQARLEAGHEKRQLATFDVAALLKDYCDATRPVAAEKALFLVAKGETPLIVEGDAQKIQRIVQNLVLNALKATERGGVKVTWEARGDDRHPQWVLCVQDTGPGFKHGSATPIARVLRRATEEGHDVEQRNYQMPGANPPVDSAPTMASQTSRSVRPAPAGEGIGLSIVKRLCEMLDASLELESSEGEGTTFRMIFPRRY